MSTRPDHLAATQPDLPGHVSPEAMAAYRATAQRRAAAQEQARLARIDQAREVARQAAELLHNRFRATGVWLFGSLAVGRFSLWSDIDLAAQGISREDFLVAVAHLQDISSDFSIDLVDIDHCRPALRAVIERDGVPL